jgi:hypothetical protein
LRHEDAPMKTFCSWAKLAGVAAAIILLHATSSTAAARPLHRLKNAAVGCFKQSDGKAMALLPKDSNGRAEEVAAVAQGQCARLHAGLFRVKQWDDGYACLAWLKQGCLWIPEESLDATMMDDGAF